MIDLGFPVPCDAATESVKNPTGRRNTGQKVAHLRHRPPIMTSLYQSIEFPAWRLFAAARRALAQWPCCQSS